MSDSQQHFFTADPKVASARRSITMALPDVSARLDTDAGVFATGRLDRGTRTLLERAPLPPPAGDILDLGCGYGPIAIACALRSPAARIWAIDVNNRALGLTRDNAARNGVGNVTAARPEEVPDTVRFAAIYSNPPIHVGKPALHELLLGWLSRLTADGAAHLVVQKNLGSDSLAKWLTEQGFPTERQTSVAGYRVLRTRPKE